jgi:hypothetical protein
VREVDPDAVIEEELSAELLFEDADLEGTEWA